LVIVYNTVYKSGVTALRALAQNFYQHWRKIEVQQHSNRYGQGNKYPKLGTGQKRGCGETGEAAGDY
jgi:hypothetical protein